MSQSLYDMMTPEQARMMLAAFKERLPTGGVADEALLAGGLPMDLLSSVAPAAPAETLPTPPIPPEGGASAAPVVTDGAAAATSPTTPQAQADSLARLRDLIGGGDRPTLEDRGRENLMNFFFSMAASRNPSFFGQLGEAGQQLARADAAARAEALQERRLDIEAGYRASQEERQLRELLRDEDPNSPRARLIEAQIARLRTPVGGGGERLGQGFITRNPETGAYQIEYPAAAGGTQVRPFAGVPATVGAATARAQQADITAAEREGRAAQSAAARTNINMSQQELDTIYRNRYNEILQQRLNARERGINPDTLLAPTEPTMPPIRIQPNQQPIR